MTAQLIDGNALAKKIRADVAARAAALDARGVKPGLAVILVGDNSASQVYVRNKVKACLDNGLHSVLEQYPASLSEGELLARVEAQNSDPTIHGILVQLPLPAHIDSHKVIETISPLKDVDGFHVASAGALMVGQPGFKPCTPYGCMKMLESIGCNPRILEPMRDILFDEKIAGSFHLTPGNAYDEADNGNRSKVHWDLVQIQRPEYGGGRIEFDGEPIRIDGHFVPEPLQALDPE